MLLSRIHRRFTTWLALLALVLGALAPTAAQAVVAASGRAQWVEVCGLSGMVWVKADSEAQQAGDHGTPASEAVMQCPWCLHGGTAGLPPLTSAAEPLPRQTDLPPAFYRAAPLSGPWAPPQARAPPLAA